MSILSSLLKLGQGTPTQQIPQAIQTTEIAKEVAPFIKDILGKGQALYKQRTEEGFVPFEGKTLADVSADQLAAEEGLRGLVGSQTANIAEARGLTRGQTDAPTLANLQSFMNPYQQAVTDIAKRQATEQFEQTTLPTLRKRAVDAGSFGGSRAAMLESQAQDNQARLLADLQAKGDLAAFQNAQKSFADQKERERLAAQGLTSLSGIENQATREELAGLEAVGSTKQKREQQLLDESYQRFLKERSFPEQQLGQYQALVAGTPISQGNVQYQQATYQPSPIASALGTAATGLGTYKAAKDLNLFAKEGGGIEQGLASLPIVERQAGDQVLSKQEMLRKIIEEISPMTGVSDVGTEKGLRELSNFQSRGDKSIGEAGADRFKEINQIVPREEGVQSQGENIGDSVKNIGSFLSSLINPTEKQIQRKQDLQGLSAVREGVEGRIAREKEFEREQQQKQKEVLLKQKNNVSSRNNTPDMIEENVEQNIVSDNNVDKENINTNKSILDSYGGTETAKQIGSLYAGEKAAIENLKTTITGFGNALEESKNARLANIGASKDALRAQAQIDFLMGLGRGLTRGGGTKGGFLADFARGGQEAVAATKDFQDKLGKLNSKELDVIDANLKDQFNLSVQSINTAFKEGQINRGERELITKEIAAKYQLATVNIAQMSSSIKRVEDILSNADYTDAERKAQILKEIQGGTILPGAVNYGVKRISDIMGTTKKTNLQTESNNNTGVNEKVSVTRNQ